jgi:hypothetical protein
MHAKGSGQTDNADHSKSSHKSITPGALSVTSLAPHSLADGDIGAPGLCLRSQPTLQALGGGAAQPQRP